jgi:predicted GTPase
MKIKEFIAARWRWLVLMGLIFGPMAFLAVAGIYYLWANGWWIILWWPISACYTLALILAWRWQKNQQLLELDFTPPLHWTDRDREAWKLVEARAKEGEKIPSERLVTISFYTESAQEMALELAKFYHPHAEDPLSNRTLPEILAVAELASHDLAQMVDQYLPGGHFMTINHWRQARRAADWYQTASAFSWMISGLFSPVNTAMRYMASQAGMAKPWQMLQQNLILWFYGAFVHRVGTYLIDLNSGRLRVGADRYREIMEGANPIAQDGAPADGSPQERPVDAVTIVLFGQSKMGKSSLINAFLGEQRAATSVLPETKDITRYELKNPDFPTPLVLLDTVGYSQAGPKEDQVRVTQNAARNADLLILVLHARNPARQADVDMLEALTKFFVNNPHLKKPPILGVLTHIDLLSPSLEWSPPYDWQDPKRPKEQQIAQAIAAAHGQFGKHLAGMVPVCTAAGKVYGIQEWLMPAVVKLVGEARAVALVRVLHKEANAAKIRKTLQQLLETGTAAAKILWWK